MPFKFESLLIWKSAFNLSDEVHHLALTFPKNEMFSLATQLRRASDSVVLNIAEGSTGLSNAEFTRFLKIALRSAIEVVACLMLAKKRKYLEADHYDKLYEEYEQLCKMITNSKII
jgi:four helix bundle protein